MTDITVSPDTGAVTSVQCGEGETYDADAVVCAVGINGAKGIVRAAPALSKYPFFANMMNLRSVDALAVRLYLDRRVRIPYQRYLVHRLWSCTRELQKLTVEFTSPTLGILR